MVDINNEKDLEQILSQIGMKEKQLSKNRTKLISSVKLLNQYKEEHPEIADKIQLVVEYNSGSHSLNMLKFVTSDFSLVESADLKMDEHGSGLFGEIKGHVSYTLDLIAGNVVDEEGNSFPIYCEDKDKLLNNELRNVGYTNSRCNCGPKQSSYGCPHVFSNGYSGGRGMELTIKQFEELGLSEEVMAEVETHIRTAYEKSDQELYVRIGELRNKSMERVNKMLAEWGDE